MAHTPLAFFSVWSKMGVMMKKTALFALAILTLFSAVEILSARTWTQASSGKEIEADFIKFENGKVFLKLPNGKTGEVPLTALSKADQEFVANAGKESAGGGGSVWPSFRGPKSDGHSPDTGLLDSWPSGGPKQLWVFKNAGAGYGSYSIVDGKLFTLGTFGTDLKVLCVDVSTGSELWSTSIGEDPASGYNTGWGNGPRSTPTYSDGMLYCLGPNGDLVCVSAEDGSKKWSKHLVEDFGGKAGAWGYSASPLVDGDNVVVAPGGTDSGIVCLNKKNRCHRLESRRRNTRKSGIRRHSRDRNQRCKTIRATL